MSSDTLSLISLACIASLVISIFVLIAFFKLAKNVEQIKESIQRTPNGKQGAIIKLTEGKKDEALVIIRESFLLECLPILSNFWFEPLKCDQKADEIMSNYIRLFKIVLPELTKEFLDKEFQTVRSVYIEKK